LAKNESILLGFFIDQIMGVRLPFHSLTNINNMRNLSRYSESMKLTQFN